MDINSIIVLDKIITHIQHMHVTNTEKIKLIKCIMQLSGHVTMEIENCDVNLLKIMYKFGDNDYKKRIKCEINLRRAKQKLIF